MIFSYLYREGELRQLVGLHAVVLTEMVGEETSRKLPGNFPETSRKLPGNFQEQFQETSSNYECEEENNGPQFEILYICIYHDSGPFPARFGSGLGSELGSELGVGAGFTPVP